MENNNTLTTEDLEQQPIFEAKDTSLSFWGGLGLGLIFLVIQLIVSMPLVLITMPEMGILDISSIEEAQSIIMPVGLTLAFVIGAWIYYKMRGLSATAFQWKPVYVKLMPLVYLLIQKDTSISIEKGTT